jgi:serine/threonine protein kinase/class 3 adenylate cyclase
VTSPPTGTVTFLFTDMEGSTSHWQRYRLQMPAVLRRHFEILRSCVESHGGYVFKTVGDACCAAFTDPMEALQAALEAQRALLAERWSSNVPVRVRMALHHGHAAEEREGDYFGPPVNLVARLLSVARGGQVLLSGVVAELVGDDLPYFEPGADIRDLGEQRLKDITRPVRVFQLLAPDLLRVEGLEPPDEEAERYRIERLLGEGGMARVYLAYEMEFDRTVALKVLREDYAEDSEVVERFGREARSAGRLSGHSNIVTIYARGRTRDGSYYLAMEYVSGGTLKDRIEREGPLPTYEVVEIALQVAQALRFAHERGIIHRDVKPQNILLTESGEAKVADFGIARVMDATALTRTGSVLGTPQYLSPEQALGQPASPRSDLYALGVVFYEMLTGELPFDAETPAGVLVKHISGELHPPRAINPDIPEQLNDITVRLLAREPEDRYSDARALVEDLQQISRGLAIGDGRRFDVPAQASHVETTRESEDREKEEPLRRYREGVESAWADGKLQPNEVQRLRDLANNELRLSPGTADDIEREVMSDTIDTILARQEEADREEERNRRLEELYTQARRLHRERRWQAVIDLFEQIRAEEPDHPDPEGLLASARDALEAQERRQRVAALPRRRTPLVLGAMLLVSLGIGVAVWLLVIGEEEAGPVRAEEEERGPDYSVVKDGVLSAEFPSDWGTATGADSEAGQSSWSSFLGDDVGASITAAPDLEGWGASVTVGAYVVASKALAESHTIEDLVVSGPNDMSGACTQEDARDFERGSFHVRVQTWSGCDGEPNLYFYTVAAVPEDRECVVVMKLGGFGEAERKIGQHVIDTFEVDCGALAA